MEKGGIWTAYKYALRANHLGIKSLSHQNIKSKLERRTKEVDAYGKRCGTTTGLCIVDG